MKKTVLAIAFAGLSSLAVAAPVAYTIDPGHFFIQFKVPHLGYSHILGTFNDVSGHYVYDSETGEIKDVNVTVNTQSLDSDHAERNNHLKSEDYLNADEFSDASFVSSGWQDGVLTGTLTLHGQSREIHVPLTQVGEGEDPWGGYRSGFEGRFTINFADYGIPDQTAQTAEIYLTGEGVRD